jgi:hypothetical protein
VRRDEDRVPGIDRHLEQASEAVASTPSTSTKPRSSECEMGVS